MKKVAYKTAKKHFENGESVALLPNKVRADAHAMWIMPSWISYETELSFDGAVAAFKYYNCNREVGLGVHYYVED